MRRHRQWLLLSLLALALFVAAGPAAAGVTPTVSVDPAIQTVELGSGQFDVRVMVDDVKDPDGLGGYTLVMTYNPNVLHAVEATDSAYVESTGNDVICLSGTVDNITGRLGLWCFIFGFLAPLPGPQTNVPEAIAVVTFEPVGEGSTVLDISGTTITDADVPENTLAAGTLNGTVMVTVPPEPTATATATDTPTATATDMPTATATDTPTATATPPPTFTPPPTWTPASTWTPQPTWTPDASPTALPTPAQATGDVNCDRTVNPVDATLILQISAGVLAVLQCPHLADTNADGMVNPLDATLVLQLSAGLIDSLPPAGIAGMVHRVRSGYSAS